MAMLVDGPWTAHEIAQMTGLHNSIVRMALRMALDLGDVVAHPTGAKWIKGYTLASYEVKP